jgi:hypothetical protein
MWHENEGKLFVLENIGGLLLDVLTVAASLQAVPTAPLFILETIKNILRRYILNIVKNFLDFFVFVLKK